MKYGGFVTFFEVICRFFEGWRRSQSMLGGGGAGEIGGTRILDAKQRMQFEHLIACRPAVDVSRILVGRIK